MVHFMFFQKFIDKKILERKNTYSAVTFGVPSWKGKNTNNQITIQIKIVKWEVQWEFWARIRKEPIHKIEEIIKKLNNNKITILSKPLRIFWWKLQWTFSLLQGPPFQTALFLLILHLFFYTLCIFLNSLHIREKNKKKPFYTRNGYFKVLLRVFNPFLSGKNLST